MSYHVMATGSLDMLWYYTHVLYFSQQLGTRWKGGLLDGTDIIVRYFL